MKVNSLSIISNKQIINDNLKKLSQKTTINIDDYITLDEETITIYTENISIGLLNALRQIAYKSDYTYYLDINLTSISINTSNKNNNNINFINKHEMLNRINSIVIDINDEELLNKYLNCDIGHMKKKINYYDKAIDFIKTSDMVFNDDNVIKLDKNINIYQTPLINGSVHIDSIILKKEYAFNDNRYCNISSFTVLPLNKNNDIEQNYDFNKIYTNYQVKIKSIGGLSADKLLPRFLNILYIKLQEPFVIENDYILFMQKGVYLENLFVEYSYNNNINIVCKNIIDNIYCYNIINTEITEVLQKIKNDIILFISVLLKIDIKTSEQNLINNVYAKYF